jgi:hypothetical protein
MFPLFNAAEPRLVRGFDVLETDHGTIHAVMEQMADAANTFMRTEPSESDRMRYAADDYATAADRLMAMLDRHLGDEEDLVIPLFLDRGEEGLGM